MSRLTDEVRWGWREAVLLEGAACFEEESWDGKVWIMRVVSRSQWP